MVDAARKVIEKPFDASAEAVNCHHNYVNREHHLGEDIFVTRKGAVSAGGNADASTAAVTARGG